MSNTLNLAVDQGSSLTYLFNVQDSTAAPFDLTGYDARLQVRKTYGSPAEINCTLANSKLVLTNALEGKLTLNLAPSDTSGIKYAAATDDSLECVYDLEIQSPTGKVYKPAKGTFTISREVTR